MSTFTVTAERVTIHPHPNANALEIAQIGLYRAIVKKGEFQTGDVAVYIPEQAILPERLITELGLTGRLGGKAKNRVTAVRLRGHVSQGLVCRPQALKDVDLTYALSERRDFADELGIIKWTPPIPRHLASDVIAAPSLIPWIGIEHIKRFPELFKDGEHVIATEKIHGSACLVTYCAETHQTFVSSKGYGAKRLAVVPDERNLYWRAVAEHGADDFAARLARQLDVPRVAVFGEVFGQGVQDLAYGAAGRKGRPGYAAFDVAYVDPNGETLWRDAAELLESTRGSGSPAFAPVLYDGPYDAEHLLKLAEGTETVSGSQAHIREGIVVRSARERFSPVTSGRAIGKIVSDAYLTRQNGTEYQ